LISTVDPAPPFDVPVRVIVLWGVTSSSSTYVPVGDVTVTVDCVTTGAPAAVPAAASETSAAATHPSTNTLTLITTPSSSVRFTSSVALALCVRGKGSTALAAVALGAHPVPGALYTGNSGVCAANISRQCMFKFRVSTDGRTLRFVKRGQAISVWACRGGGGEAVFGGKYGYRIPLAGIRSDGTFSGAGGHGFRRLRITGSFTGSGRTAVLKFVLPNQHCHTRQLALRKQ
jgi:hypothetical protein